MADETRLTLDPEYYRRRPGGFDLDRTFTHHPPTPDQIPRYEEIRAAGKWFAEVILRCAPESRERSSALTSVQQAVMWTNAAIAIHEAEVSS